MSLRQSTPCDYGDCPYDAQYYPQCEYWCGADEPRDDPETEPEQEPVHEYPTWKIPVTWEMMGFLYVSAPTLADAIDVAYDESTPLPYNGDYIEGSFELADDEDAIRSLWNDDMEDLEDG
jgi:hypothetical protein